MLVCVHNTESECHHTGTVQAPEDPLILPTPGHLGALGTSSGNIARQIVQVHAQLLVPPIPRGIALGREDSLPSAHTTTRLFLHPEELPGGKTCGANPGESRAKWDTWVTVMGELCPCKFT